MSLSTMDSPVLDRYYHYLDDAVPWHLYSFSSVPYWTRFHDEYERLRACLRSNERMVEEMSKISDSYLTTISSSNEEVSTSSSTTSSSTEVVHTPVTDSYFSVPITSTYIPTTTVSSSAVESDISAWRSAITDLQLTLNDLTLKTTTWGDRIVGLVTDGDRTYILKTEFGIESVLRDMEAKRKRCEDYCVRIHDTLKHPIYKTTYEMTD